MPHPQKPSDFDFYLQEAAEAVGQQVRKSSAIRIRMRRTIAELRKPIEAPKVIEDEEEDEDGEGEED